MLIRKRFPLILATMALVALLVGASTVYAQVRDPAPPVDPEKKFPAPRVVGPPPPMADIWSFDSITITPATGAIEAIQLISLTQPDVGGQRQPSLRIHRDTVRVTPEEAAAILGDAEYRALLTEVYDALHAIAIAQGKEPAP